jgi:S1-C subfamily serine protease
MTESRLPARWTILGAAVLILTLGVGCGFSTTVLQSASPTATPLPPLPTAAPGEAQPTATAVMGMVTPMPVEEQVAAANALEEQIVAVHEGVGPSVVNITNRSIAYDMFMQPVPQEGSGSGFMYDAQGHIVTNFHVVEGADQLIVTLSNGAEYEAELVGEDAINDLAVIRVDASQDLPAAVPIADSDLVRVGQFVVAIGNPFGLEQTLTVGVISALGRIIQSPTDDRFIGEAIQTDAAINPGNSGGPLLDLQGRVIGVNSQIISPSGASSGVGFAVSANTVRRVVPELIARGYYPHAWLGISSLPLNANTTRVLREAGVDIAVERGLLILESVSGGPADQSGVRGGERTVRIGRFSIPVGGDILVAIDGEPLLTSRDLTLYLDTQTEVGQQVELTIVRDGAEERLTVTLGERPRR